ncbi:hypothetical protein Tco_0517840 [Tanacetum coccineum]
MPGERVNQAVLAPVQAPQPPLTDMTLLQRLARIEDEVHELRQSIVVAPIRPLTTLLSVAHKCHTRGRPNRGLVSNYGALGRIQNASYAISKKIYSKNILEDEKRGPYSKETPIRRIELNGYGVST